MRQTPLWGLLPAAVVTSTLAVACAANPGPPPVVSDDDPALSTPSEESSSATPTPVDAANRSHASIGVDPLGTGLNPHLIANNTELVDEIAELVLPSAFHGEKMDTDLLDSAREVIAPPGTALRVVYRISSAAQWSDGTPISGADFIYLWQGMVATPGVVSPAGYRAIAGISTSDGGRTVTVDFSDRVADWHLLFADLLPSHLLGEESFDSALANDIPASAGRYKVDSVDRARGVITLNRNDRYWGTNPARIDIIYLNEISSTEQGVNMLRSGQIGFADLTPQQTTEEFLSLLPEVSSEELTRARQLRLQIALEDAAARRELSGLIDTAQIARLATGRNTALSVPYGGTPDPTDSTDALRGLGRTVRIAADPTDDVSARAASVIVDQLRARGIDAEAVEDKMSNITGQLLPAGDVDAVVTWEDTALTSLTMANAFLCSGDAADDPAVTASASAAPVTAAPDSVSVTDSAAPPESTESETTVATVTAVTSVASTPAAADSTVPWAGSLTGYCPAEARQTRNDILAGYISPEDALERVRELNREEHLYVPLLDETRIHALGRGIVGPGTTMDSWREGLLTAPEWELG